MKEQVFGLQKFMVKIRENDIILASHIGSVWLYAMPDAMNLVYTRPY